VPEHRGESNINMIVGLGNPGAAYVGTRHNVGFEVIDRLALDFRVTLRKGRFQAFWGMGLVEGERALLVKPLGFMNRSGEVVGQMLRYFKADTERVMVVHDDLDLDCGRIKLVRSGGSGGHRGVASVIQNLGHKDFPRLKLGIGRPGFGEPVDLYVLEQPYPEQMPRFQEMITFGAEAVRTMIASGLMVAMNRFNRRGCE
jgi:PTH1 family peptidyl-tRNA hydrolase